MANVSAQTVMKLREMTGVSMSKCKEALEACQGDIEKSVDFLRKQGMASAVKKADRDTKEGKIAAHETADKFALVQVACETDFVLNNALFQELALDLAKEAIDFPGIEVEAFSNKKWSKDPSVTIDHHRAILVQKIGENIQIKRVLSKNKEKGSSYGLYSHLGGKIFCVVEIGGEGEESLAREIALHSAAASPEYLTPAEIPDELLAREKEIARGQVKGKPENIIEKIVDGKLQAFYQQVCLNKQKFIKDESLSIEELVSKRAKETGKPVVLKSFIRWSVV